MQSTYLSRSLFGCTCISFITAALFVGTLALAGNAGAQEPTSSQRPVPESPAMAEHKAAPTSLRELMQEAEQKNPQIAASFHGWQAARYVPKQASALPETQLSGAAIQRGQPAPLRGLQQQRFRLHRVRRLAGHSLPRQTAVARRYRRTRSGLHGSPDRFNAPNCGGKPQDDLFPPGLHSANPRGSAEKRLATDSGAGGG